VDLTNNSMVYRLNCAEFHTTEQWRGSRIGQVRIVGRCGHARKPASRLLEETRWALTDPTFL